MCGIAGIWSGRPATREQLAAAAEAMAARLQHRGPDDSGLAISGSVALAFRRLSIIDLSPAGHQPMSSLSGRYTIVFNGEVYNFEQIRAELTAEGKAPRWRGHSDTEVLLAAIEAWGLVSAVRRFNGMFAFAVWDARDHELHLVRDRLGVKPLHYARTPGGFVFASELKALTAHEDLPRDISRTALALYTRFGYVPAPYTIYENVLKVMPGTIVTARSPQHVTAQPYWSLREVVERGVANRVSDPGAALEELHAIALDSVRLRMIADVPLGVFLSGGIDSSLVTSLMQVQSASPVRTFTIGFAEGEYDEAKYAAAIARHLGTDHTELYVTPEDALALIPALPEMYDEPFADSSQMPTFLVSRLARQSVTVSLSGDGGDEFYAGYDRYTVTRALWNRIGRIPSAARPALSAALRAVPGSLWNRAFSPANGFLPRRLRRTRAAERIHHFAKAMRADDPDRFYLDVVGFWSDLVLGGGGATMPLLEPEARPSLDDFIERSMYFDQMSYLPDDILVKVDRASMATSLESREPLLDHRLVEYSWRLPLSIKMENGRGKAILRKLLAKYVPPALFERRKQGFGIPIDHWLRGPLRDWAESLLDERRLRADGYFRAEAVRAKWREHLGGGEWQHHLWAILMFQAWLDRERGAGDAQISGDRFIMRSPI